ncbi:MAG: hypothetical protein E5V33_28590 [Mesorhizobium sp.]|nr:MAG: hypothetical protein E5V33_28590 [Mesorhizobium sp.]
MIAVIFEVEPAQGRRDAYLGIAAAKAGRGGIFAGYRLRIAHVVRDYGLTDRTEAPQDSRAVNG